MRRAGFTLVEVLIALAVFALIGGAGALVLSQAVDSRFAVRTASDRIAEIQRARALMRADIGQAVGRRTRTPTGRPLPQPMVAGQAPGEPLLVLTRAGWSNPGEEARPSLQRVEYRLVGDRLERRASRYLDGARPGPPQVLFRGVRQAQVIFVRDGAEAPAYIVAPDRPLPDAVKISLTLDGYGPVDQLFLVGPA
ncbi:MAG: type II secretion system minor pseudopilin GspJ [Brevundimonas sp.]|uniref:type II secretion system minor pseudopilin GspJ n=1 Tax=Brevundimonas sp. TaxID=1871086 RepID=UPI0025C12F27|nr:type II secretion system minor pseudopilin GspJ [Brevundimonas sp.]MBX3476257.1 type II secretion system minor pseudopilin GspJ [Brevundimonas sp.]